MSNQAILDQTLTTEEEAALQKEVAAYRDLMHTSIIAQRGEEEPDEVCIPDFSDTYDEAEEAREGAGWEAVFGDLNTMVSWIGALNIRLKKLEGQDA